MQLLALSDLHVEHRPNREALTALRARREDWLILAGDVSDSVAGLTWTLDVLGPKFARLLWVPGNHELWTGSAQGERDRGEARYRRLVEVCRERSVLTPEDAFVDWPLSVQGDAVRIALLFLLYDYSFAPDAHVGRAAAVSWAAEAGVLAADEVRLHPDPHVSREDWCRARVAQAEARLFEASRTHALVLVNHWPLRRDLVRLGRVARYSPWCGTRASESFHRRYRALVSVHGHLHVRATDERDGVRFEEVSLGYPGHWDQTRAVDTYLRRIL
jgi:3',5'-cyclic AMP phosphodiesterase CpdA